MKHLNIFDNTFYTLHGVSQQLDALAKYMISNRSAIRIPEQDVMTILKTKAMIETPISQIFELAMRENILQNLFSTNRVTGDTTVPEIFTIPNILLDVKQIEPKAPGAYKALNTFPELNDRIILNITSYLKRSNYEVSDLNELQALYVSGLLVRSYFESTNWLTPEAIQFGGKSYSISLGSAIAQSYKLNIGESQIVNTILTAYFHQMCHTTSDTEWTPSIATSSYLGSRFDIVERLKMMQEHLGGTTTMNLGSMIELIKKMGPGRLESFEPINFSNLSLRMGPQFTSLIAIEYPPLWMQLCLMAISGFKIGLYTGVLRRNQQLMKEAKLFGDGLKRNREFLPKLKSLI